MCILIICTHFPPLNRTGARRPYYLAKELCDQGHTVTVLTSTEPEDATWGVNLDGIKVMRCERTNEQRDMNAVQLALARLLSRTRNSSLNGPLRVLADLTLPLDHSSRWDVSLQEIKETLGDAEIVVSTGPAWSAAQFGMRIATAWGATFIVDYRDPWSIADPSVHMDIVSGHGKGLAGFLRKFALRRHERRIGRSAFALTAVSQPVLFNAQCITQNRRGAAFQGGFVPNPDLPVAPLNDKLTVTYTGRVYPEQDWSVVLDALDLLATTRKDFSEQFTLKLVGTISSDPGLLEKLHLSAIRTGALTMVPRMPRGEALREQREADAVLHLAYRGRRGYLPVKFLEYLNSGRPILLISKENDLMEAILTDTRTGTIVPDTKALVELLDTRLNDHSNGRPWSIEPDQSILRSFEYSKRMRPWAEQILAWHAERMSLEISKIKNQAT